MQDYVDAMSQYRGAAQLEQNIETAKQIGMEYLLKWAIPGGVTVWTQEVLGLEQVVPRNFGGNRPEHQRQRRSIGQPARPDLVSLVVSKLLSQEQDFCRHRGSGAGGNVMN